MPITAHIHNQGDFMVYLDNREVNLPPEAAEELYTQILAILTIREYDKIENNMKRLAKQKMADFDKLK